MDMARLVTFADLNVLKIEMENRIDLRIEEETNKHLQKNTSGGTSNNGTSNSGTSYTGTSNSGTSNSGISIHEGNNKDAIAIKDCLSLKSQRKKDQLRAIRVRYTENSTIHGFSYALYGSLRERVVWSILFLAACVCAWIMVWTVNLNWWQGKTQEIRSLEKMSFMHLPKITICPSNGGSTPSEYLPPNSSISPTLLTAKQLKACHADLLKNATTDCMNGSVYGAYAYMGDIYTVATTSAEVDQSLLSFAPGNCLVYNKNRFAMQKEAEKDTQFILSIVIQ